jgi:hypothetical protein
MPVSEPAEITHWNPVQQSEVDVQVPPDAMQALPQRKTPPAPGTHGAPPQHSAEKVHWLPAAMQQVWPGVPL